MMQAHSEIAAARRSYARTITADSGCAGGPLEAAFATVPREDFLPPAPWRIFGAGVAANLVSANPEALYCDGLVAIDEAKGINNGQPSLHAGWICAVDPRPGDTVVHVGCGGGYYSAILASLVGREGHVHAFEIEPEVARLAARALAAYPTVTLHRVSGAGGKLPAADVIYVNAAASAPQAAWLTALRPGGRLVFPWSYSDRGTAAMLVTRTEDAQRDIFAARSIGRVGFIAMEEEIEHRHGQITADAVLSIRSLQARSVAAPDASSIAVFDTHWFSSSEAQIA